MGRFNLKICTLGMVVFAGMFMTSYGRASMGYGGSPTLEPSIQYKELKIQFPEEVRDAKATVVAEQQGHAPRIYRLDGRTGPDHQIPAPSDTTSVKLLIYYPGYKLVGMEVAGKDIVPDKPLTPKFEKLPTVLLKATFTYSDGKPVANKQVAISQSLPLFSYFVKGMGYSGAGLPRNAPDAIGYTDSSGILSIEVPQILDDPILMGLVCDKPIFYAEMEVDKLNGFTADLVSSYFPAQRSYPDPIDIKAVYQGRISGKIEKSFLDRNGITAPLGDQHGSIRAYIFDPILHRGCEISTKADGSFTYELPAGKYNVSVEYQNPGKDSPRKTIPAGPDVVVGEAEEKVVEIK